LQVHVLDANSGSVKGKFDDIISHQTKRLSTQNSLLTEREAVRHLFPCQHGSIHGMI
jgi:hypothetical protein